MAGRPRGSCPSKSIRNPGLTRAQLMRQAKSAAFVKEAQAREDALRPGPSGCEARTSKPRVPKFTRGPPPAEPRRVQMTKPTMTKAMLARIKHAQEFQKKYEARNEPVFAKPGARGCAPVGGDARFGREPRKKPIPEGCETREPCRRPQGEGGGGGGLPRSRCETGGSGTSSKTPPRCSMPQPRAHSSVKRARRLFGEATIPEESFVTEKTNELAESMNAEVVQAEPVGSGPVQNIIIPPGTVSQCRTTIVSLPQQSMDTSSRAANRSMQVINESLDEQDAVESATVNNKLCDLQHARRDFVMAVANVGGNAINLTEVPETRPAPCAAIEPRGPIIYDLPDADHDAFRIDYGRDHPAVVAAREHAQRTRAALLERENQTRIDRRFGRFAREDCGLRLDVPIEQEIMEGDVSFEEDEETGMVVPCQSRIRASMPVIPRKHVAAVPDTIDVDELQRFFDVHGYPEPPEDPNRPPPGREGLNPDLWGLEDPWYRCPEPEQGPDLIDFND